MGNSTKKMILRTIQVIIALFVVVCTTLYFLQEQVIFHPEKLDKNYTFQFGQPFEEINLHTENNELLNGLLFKADSSKGLIFYLHGNAGSLASWGRVAKTYTDLYYDVYIPDYPGYGKSEGSIHSEQQLYDALQHAYNSIIARYGEDKIVVLGYSIGTGMAAKIASSNNPRLLILQAPYYSLIDMMKHSYPFVPTFLLKYKFRTDQLVKECKMPVTIFHGDADEVIYYGSSTKLKTLFKKPDTLITLQGQGHNGMTDDPEYKTALRYELDKPGDTANAITVTAEITKAYDGLLVKEYRSNNSYPLLNYFTKQKSFDVKIAVTNNSVKPIYYHQMSCSWESIFEVEGGYLLYGPDCDRNFGTTVHIQPGDTKIYYTSLVRRSLKYPYMIKPENTARIGLILIDDIFKPVGRGIGYIFFDSKLKQKTIWSNTIHL